MTMDMAYLSQVNKKRCESSTEGFNHPMNEWSEAEWTNAISGEVGEAMDAFLELVAASGKAGNIAKKMIRFRASVFGNNPGKSIEDYRVEIGKELADIILYADLTATALGIDLWGYANGTVRAKFNEVSDKLGSSIKL